MILDSKGLEAALQAVFEWTAAKETDIPIGVFEEVAKFAITAYLTNAKPRVKVKSLEWFASGPVGEMFQGHWSANGAGEYLITLCGDEFDVFRSGRYLIGEALGSLEEAQSVAQADYEARIFAALEITS